jgi:hypothetical protein
MAGVAGVALTVAEEVVALAEVQVTPLAVIFTFTVAVLAPAVAPDTV